jgi:hypothetical protein
MKAGKLYRFNHSTSDRIMRATGVYSQRAKSVDWGWRARWRVDRLLGNRHRADLRVEKGPGD